MAYDEGLAQRLTEYFEDVPGVTDKKMFGGLCFMHQGNMVGGIVGDELMLRVGPDAYEACLAEPHAREMDFTGRTMKGMIYVAAEGLAEDEDLEAWVERALAFASSLPAKGRGKSPKKKKVAKKKAAKKKAARKRGAKVT